LLGFAARNLRARPRAGNLQEVLGCLQENFDKRLLLVLVRQKGLEAHGKVWDEGDQQPYF